MAMTMAERQLDRDHDREHQMRDLDLTSETSSSSSSSTMPPVDGGKQANTVLFACSLLQLPVWSFMISYGVLQAYYVASDGDGERSRIGITGDIATTGVIGTTGNGIMYLSMPLLFGLFTRQHARHRKHAALLGILLSSTSLVLSSVGSTVWQLVLTQGVVQALGSTLLYSSSTIYIDEWFVRKKGFAYGVILGVKSLVGVGVPLLFEVLLERVGYRWMVRIWAGVNLVFALPGIWLLRSRYSCAQVRVDGVGIGEREGGRGRRLAWSFLRHRTFWVFQAANVVFSTSYGLPQTYLATFASSVLGLSASSSALVLVALNAPSVAASLWFGLLSDGRGLFRSGKSMSIASVSLFSALGASVPTLLFWGLVPGPGVSGVALLTLFAIVYGFFAGGYSATWGGVVKDMQREAEARDEAVDTGLLFGLLNGGRGVGYVVGGFVGVELMKFGAVGDEASRGWGYDTAYGSLILFTGIGSALGGVSVLCRNGKALGWSRSA